MSSPSIPTARRGPYALVAAALLALPHPTALGAQQAAAPAAPPVPPEAPPASGPPVTVTTLADTLHGAVGGVAVDALGFVYVADFGEKVWKVTPFGDVEVLTDQMYGASGNTVDARGNLLQASFNAGTVSRIRRDGSVETVAEGLRGPVGVALGDEGALIVCECRANALARVAPDGTVSEFASGDLFNCPNGITRDSDGVYWVVNFSDGRLLKVTAEGRVSEHAVIPGGGNGHVVAASGALWVAGFRAQRIFRVSPEDGSMRTVAGNGRFGSTDGEGLEAGFATPNGIAWDPTRETLYVNDYVIPFPQRRSVPARSLLRRIQLPSLPALFRQTLESEGLDAAAAAYREYKAGNPRFTELEVNALGYQYLQQGRVDVALKVFELNAESYPNSFNTWDSLAEAHMTAGNREKAIELYEKSLELNPANNNAKQKLEELGVGP